MNLQVTGVVTNIMPVMQGTSKSGNAWAKQQFVITTQEQYPKMICFTAFGQDKIDQFALKLNEQVTVCFDINAHEFNGRYYNDINAWNVMRPGAQQQQQQGGYQQQSPVAAQQQAQQQQMQQMQQAVGGAPFPNPTANQGGNGGKDDLPF